MVSATKVLFLCLTIAFVHAQDTAGVGPVVATKEKGDRGDKIKGLHEAVEKAVSTALAQAGISIDGANKHEMKDVVKASGIDIHAVKTAAVQAFLEDGVRAGTISAEQAVTVLEHLSEKERHHLLRDDLEDAIHTAIAGALGLSQQELDGLSREDVYDRAVEAKVDLKQIKETATETFVAIAVASGRLTEEEAAEIGERNGHMGGKGRKNGDRGNGKGGNRGNDEGGRRGNDNGKGSNRGNGKGGDRGNGKGGDRGNGKGGDRGNKNGSKSNKGRKSKSNKGSKSKRKN